MHDPHLRLIRALRPHAGDGAALLRSSAEPWASVTFAGMRHRLTYLLHGQGAGFGRLIPEALAIPGHLLVELKETSRRPHGSGTLIEIDALTLEKG